MEHDWSPEKFPDEARSLDTEVDEGDRTITDGGEPADGVVRSGLPIFTPDSWIAWAACILLGHDWSAWYYVENQKRRKCVHCGLERKDVEPLVADGGTPQDGMWHDGPSCPNCQQPAGDAYETGELGVREFDCDNENCRCQVFRAADDSAEDRGKQDTGVEQSGGSR